MTESVSVTTISYLEVGYICQHIYTSQGSYWNDNTMLTSTATYFILDTLFTALTVWRAR